MAALQRALALAEVEHVAVRVGQHLDLDVPRAGQKPLDEHALVGEPGLGLAPGRLERGVEIRRGDSTTRIPRPPPPAAALTSSGYCVPGRAAPRPRV